MNIINHDHLYLIEFEPANEVVYNFKVWNIAFWAKADGSGGMSYFDSKTNLPVDDKNSSSPYFQGMVKWDGCMEVKWGETHFCGKSDWDRLNHIVKDIYDYCEQNMEHTELE